MDCAVTVCDTGGTILYMNDKARTTFARHGDMVGKNLFDCHSERSRGIIQRLIADGGTNVYTIEKNGVRQKSRWRFPPRCRTTSATDSGKEKHQGCRGSPSRVTTPGFQILDFDFRITPPYPEFRMQPPSHTRFPGFRVCVPGNSGYVRSRPAQFRPGKSYRRTKFLEGLLDPLIFMPQKFCRVYLLKCKIYFTFILSQTFKQPRYDKGITTSPQF